MEFNQTYLRTLRNIGLSLETNETCVHYVKLPPLRDADLVKASTSPLCGYVITNPRHPTKELSMVIGVVGEATIEVVKDNGVTKVVEPIRLLTQGVSCIFVARRIRLLIHHIVNHSMIAMVEETKETKQLN